MRLGKISAGFHCLKPAAKGPPPVPFDHFLEPGFKSGRLTRPLDAFRNEANTSLRSWQPSTMHWFKERLTVTNTAGDRSYCLYLSTDRQRITIIFRVQPVFCRLINAIHATVVAHVRHPQGSLPLLCGHRHVRYAFATIRWQD